MSKNDDSAQDILGRLMAMAGKAMGQRLERNLSEAGIELSGAQMVLLQHIGFETGVNQQTLTDHMFLDKTRVTRIIDSLEEKNLVVRVPDKADRRQNLVYLTAAGREALTSFPTIAIETEQQASRGIDPIKFQDCKEVLRQVRENLAD